MTEGRSQEIGDPNCPICRGYGWVYVDVPVGHPNFGKVKPCRCTRTPEEIKEKQKSLLKYCYLPTKAEDMTFDTFRVNDDNKRALEAARLVAEEKLKWLILAAEADHGKTHLAVAIANEWIKKLRPARYIYSPMLFVELRSGFDNQADETYQKKLDQFLKVPLLILDDLGVEKSSPWVKEQIDLIVDSRLMNKQSLVVTTNLGSADMSERVVSRLKRTCNDPSFGRSIAIKGESYTVRLENEKRDKRIRE